jgi:Rod binding domain-containing protein
MDVRLSSPTADLALADGSDPLVARLRGIDRGAPAADLAEAATEFEAYLIQSLLSQARKTVDEGGLFGSLAGGHQALVDSALSRHLARAGGLGLASQLLRQWEGLR